ncbi:transmembrane 25 isoform X2 [Pelobates cultripes]|uniref:Transmembrane 25 isoform X2 n=1 Tax=Pelobates cultripes TaxID=61616 RepID=A0AAD1T591_PELCU|nr:transmembrane 25 isoform X2 [Pelobates cultripes]
MLLSVSLLLLYQLFHRGIGEPLQNEETQGFPCEGASPSLTWYLNGVKQDTGVGKDPPFLLPLTPGSSSILTLAESGADNCSEPSQREELLSMHFPADSPGHISRSSGLSLLLLLVIRAQPPTSFTLRGQDGKLALNSSRLLLLDTRNVEGNGSLKVKVSTENGGISRASVSALGLLSTRVELPLLALVVGVAGATAGIILVNSLICCFLLRRKRREHGMRNQLTLSTSNNMKLNNSCLPREHMSLPSNLQLNDLRPQARGLQDASADDTQEDVSLRCGILSDTGFDRFPLVGYIYKAPSVSSDEIWL